MTKDHPLSGNQYWKFTQPELGFTAPFTLVPEKGKRKTHTVSTTNTCREGIISNARAIIQSHITNEKEIREGGWQNKNKPQRAVVGEADLTRKESKPTELRIQWNPQWMAAWPYGGSTFAVEDFLQLCDIVMGPVCVLLGPWRPEGDWWKTDPETAIHRKSGGYEYVHWQGSDNWFLAHPTTVGIATALYRQCYHLCGTDLVADILKALSASEVEDVMSGNSQKLALRLVKKTRPYIEVPVGRSGSRRNYAFTLGLWRRLIRLQRAIRRHGGYEAALGQGFAEGWGLLGAYQYSGLWHFWGDEDSLTDHHRHLMKMGAPRKAANGQK